MKFLCKLFGHSWADRSWNKWSIAIEQKCRRCGAERYHLFEHYRGFDEPEWQVGPHPGPKAKGFS